MKLATIAAGGRDGTLVIVSKDCQHYVTADGIAATLQQAIENWHELSPQLLALYAALNQGKAPGQQAVDTKKFSAPLPRAWQWLDGSVFDSHGALMDQVLGIKAEKNNAPLMYQGISNQFYGPHDDIPVPSEELGIDFEGEFGVIVDDVPMGTSAEKAQNHIRLLVQINDWSLRALAGPEMKTGFGWIQAKPASSMAPFAITPDELGEHWKDARVHLHLAVDWNEKRFGKPHGGPMGFGFDELVAHAAFTRSLCAGTVIGSVRCLTIITVKWALPVLPSDVALK